MRLDGWPSLTLGSITEQVHDDGASRDRLIDLEQILSWNPAILFRFFPRGAVLADANDDIQAIVSEIETLTVALGAVADQGEGVVLEVVLRGQSETWVGFASGSESAYKKLLAGPVLSF